MTTCPHCGHALTKTRGTGTWVPLEIDPSTYDFKWHVFDYRIAEPELKPGNYWPHGEPEKAKPREWWIYSDGKEISTAYRSWSGTTTPPMECVHVREVLP